MASLEEYGIEPKDTGLSDEQFIDAVKQISRETYEDEKKDAEDLDPGISERIAEEVEKHLREWQDKTLDEKRKAITGAKDALASFDKTKGLDRTKDDVPDGGVFARWAPFYAKQMDEYGQVTNARTKELAENGIGETGYRDAFVAGTQEKFLNAGEIVDGGAMAPQPVADDFIELLREETIVRSSGATIIELPEGGTKIPKQTQGSTGHWVGEGEAPDESQPKFELERLEAQKLAILVPLSNDLVRRSPRGVEQIVTQDVRSTAIVEENSAFLFGDGTSGKPKGIYASTDAANKFERSTDSGSVTVDTRIRDLNKVAYKVEGADIEPIRPGYAGHPRTMRDLMSLRGSDSLLFANQLSQGMLLGDPARFTTAFPRTLNDSGDGSNDETRLAYGDWAKVLIGDTYNLRVASSQEATVQLGSGWKSMFASDMTALVVFHEAGIMLRYPKAFGWIEGVDWGASFDS